MTISTFEELNLPPLLKTSLARMQYVTPTPVQAQAIPLAMEGRDILGSAQTGTGKTAAFAIPMITRILASPRGSALILTPTRELAAQVMEVIQDLLGARSFIPTVLLIGGDPMPTQIAKLRMRPRIIVGTPGRINDHLERGNLILHDFNYLVLDETDRMLDMGFGIQIDRILKYLPAGRQTLLFSATIPAEIERLSAKYLTKPARVAIGSTTKVANKIQQDIVHVTDQTKYEELLKQIEAREGSIIMFVKTKRGAERMAEKLNRRERIASAIHGDLHQRKREQVIQSFRDRKFRILVATDIAARGLDIPHIEHVINYDLPQAPEDYIHRIGRTARNGSEGSALCLISPDDYDRWKAIHRLINPGEPLPPMPRSERQQHHGKPNPHPGKRSTSGRSRRFRRSHRPGNAPAPAGNPA